jgi:hypothetical protein
LRNLETIPKKEGLTTAMLSLFSLSIAAYRMCLQIYNIVAVRKEQISHTNL